MSFFSSEPTVVETRSAEKFHELFEDKDQTVWYVFGKSRGTMWLRKYPPTDDEVVKDRRGKERTIKRLHAVSRGKY